MAGRKPNRTGKLLGLYIPPELKARLDERAALERRTTKAVVVLAIERYLAQVPNDLPPDASRPRGRKRKEGPA